MFNICTPCGGENVIPLDNTANIGEGLYHILAGNVYSEEGVYPFRLELYRFGGLGGVANVDNSVYRFTCTEHNSQLAGTVSRRLADCGVKSLFKAGRSLGSHAELFGGGSDRAAEEVCRLEHNGNGVIVYAGIFAAHNARYGRGFFAVGDNQHFGRELSLNAV